jgi:hypothetical protein
MADQVKVFKSGTVTAADLVNSNELVLLQTDATTKAVVKDVLVTSTAPLLSDGSTKATVELYNDTVKLADLNTATGSEVIDTNSKLYYKLTPTPTVSGSFGYATASTNTSLVNSTTNVYYTGVSPYLNKDDAVSNYGLASDATIIRTHFDPSFTNITTSGGTSNTVATMTQPAFYYPSQDGNTAYYYFWDGNSNTYLYKTTATDGITTSNWSNFQNDVYAGWTFDIKNNVLAASPSSFIYMVNPETGVTTTKSMSSWPSSSSYTSNAACNNYFFSSRSSSYTSVIHYTPLDTTTTAGRQLQLPQTYTSGGHMSFAACYNPTEDKYYFLIGTAHSNMQIYTATGAQISSNTNFSVIHLGSVQGLNIFPFTIDSNRFICGDSDGNFYLMSGGTNYKVYMNNNTATVLKSFIQTSYYISGWFEKAPTATSTAAASLTDINLDITCKVSGVEITGV